MMQFLITAALFAVLTFVLVTVTFIYDTLVSWWERHQS